MLGTLLVGLIAIQRPAAVPDDAALVESLRALPASRDALEHADSRRVQVLLANESLDAKGRPVLVRRGFRVDAEYFYPGNAIELLAAVAALEDVNDRHEEDARISETTPLAFHPLFAGQAIEDRDVTHVADGTITLRHEIRKLFLAADDAAANRLYEYVGQDALAQFLSRAGLTSARIVHRLSEPRSEDEDRRTPRVDFTFSKTDRATIPARVGKKRITDLRTNGIRVGTAYVDGTRVIDEPMSFARRNAIQLVELQDALAKLANPRLVLDGAAYGITEAQRDFLLNSAAEYPGESHDPRYPKSEYPDAWGKFLLPGLERVAPRSSWRIVNKVGRAYGFSVENAWVVHRPSGRALFVSAAIYTNANGVLNDGKYEYEEAADPFLAALGEIVGRELAR
jgi:hypothetical protein